jgi:dihydrofolate reductase
VSDLRAATATWFDGRMRKLIMMMSVSLDGFFERPDGDISWNMVAAELHQHFNDELGTMDAFLDGRVTWELMAGFWPTADQRPGATAQEAEFARIWRDMPKVVYSRTLTEAGWNTTIEREVDPEAIRRWKREPGGDLMIGGANVAATFRRYGLIDEYRLYLNPLYLGAGHPLFPPPEGQVSLRLEECRAFGNGVLLTRYAPV